MRSCWILLLLSAMLAANSGAPAQSSPSASPPPPSFKVGVTNVLVDVVVTSHHGAPVDGLSRDSFRVLENGREQPIVSFEAHTPSAALAAIAPRSLPPGVLTNAQAIPDSDTVDVLLLDALNTPTDNQRDANRALVEYLKTLPVDKPIAVFTLDIRLHLLEDFTSDHLALLQAVEAFSRQVRKSPLLKTKQDTAEQMKHEDEKIELALSLKPQYRSLGDKMLAILQQFNANRDSSSESIRVQYTLAAFEQLGRYLSGIPGRKNVIWLSGSFPLAILPDPHLKNSFEAARDFSTEVDHTASLLANARVAIYPIDARGLFPQSSAAISGGSIARDPERVRQAESAEFSEQAEEQMSLHEVARATGGEAISNTNDLKSALAEVDRNGEHYYSLAYVPADRSQGDKPRKIEVRVHPGKYDLAYRRSYVPAEASRQGSAVRSFAALMQHGTPGSTQITFRLLPLRVAPQPATVPIAGSNPSAPRPVTRYTIEYDVDAAPFVLNPSADGVLHGTATLLAIAYDRDGKPLNSVSNTLNIKVPPAQYPQFMKAGIRYREQLDLPAKAAWLRAGVLDPSSGRMGSLEVSFPSR